MSSAPLGPPPAGGDVDRGPSAVALFWVLVAVSSLAVSLRFWGRIIIRRVGWDDWTMLFTLVLFTVSTSLLTYYASIGGLRHLYYLTPPEAEAALRMSWLSQPYSIVGFATGKVAVALLTLRLIGPNTIWRKWILYFCMVTAVVFSGVNIILTYAQCTPVNALWEPALIETGQATCWNPAIQTDFAIFLASWNVLVDAVLAILPATIFYGLNMSVPKKLGLCVLLGLGLVAAICAAIKTTYLASLNARSDLTWDTYNLYVWSAAELFVIIVCGSVPPMKPVYDRYIRRTPPGASRTNYTFGYGSGGGAKATKGSKGSKGSNSGQSAGSFAGGWNPAQSPPPPPQSKWAGQPRSSVDTWSPTAASPAPAAHARQPSTATSRTAETAALASHPAAIDLESYAGLHQQHMSLGRPVSTDNLNLPIERPVGQNSFVTLHPYRPSP